MREVLSQSNSAVKVPCPVCCKEGRNVWYLKTKNKESFTIWRCPGCGLTYSHNEDKKAIDYKQVYGQDFYEQGLCAQTSPVREINERRVVAGVLDFLKKNLPSVPGRMLDVGSGDGLHLKLFHEAGWDVQGTEVSPFAIEHVRAAYGFPVSLGDLRNIPFDERSFDYVQMRHVIEHVPEDPVGILQRIALLLKPGGILRLDTPNLGLAGRAVLAVQHAACFKRKLLGQPLGDYLYSYGNLEPPEHVLWFTRRSLSIALRKAGLKPLYVIATHQGDPLHYPLKWHERLTWIQHLYRASDRLGSLLGAGNVLVCYATVAATESNA